MGRIKTNVTSDCFVHSEHFDETSKWFDLISYWAVWILLWSRLWLNFNVSSKCPLDCLSLWSERDLAEHRIIRSLFSLWQPYKIIFDIDLNLQEQQTVVDFRLAGLINIGYYTDSCLVRLDVYESGKDELNMQRY